MKIGLVCPYIYPRRAASPSTSGYLYENLRQRGHDVRILTASHGPQRASEGDIIRLGVGFSVPINGVRRHAHVLAALPGPDRRRARTRAVRPAPLPRAVRAVPVAVPAPRIDERQRRDLPRLRRLLAVVRVRQPGAAAATRRGSTAGSRSARPPAISSTASSRATTRSSRTASTSRRSPTPSRSPAGRTARRTCCSSGRHEPRKGLLDLLKAHRILRKTGSGHRLLVVGSGPQEREARRYVATRGLQGVEFLGRVSRRREGAALPDGRCLCLARDRRRVVRHRPARGDGRRHPDRVLGHPRLQGRRPARARGPARAAARAA